MTDVVLVVLLHSAEVLTIRPQLTAEGLSYSEGH